MRVFFCVSNHRGCYKGKKYLPGGSGYVVKTVEQCLEAERDNRDFSEEGDQMFKSFCRGHL